MQVLQLLNKELFDEVGKKNEEDISKLIFSLEMHTELTLSFAQRPYLERRPEG